MSDTFDSFTYAAKKRSFSEAVYEGQLGEAAGALIYEMSASGVFSLDRLVQAAAAFDRIQDTAGYCAHLARYLGRKQMTGMAAARILAGKDGAEEMPLAQIAYFINPYTDIAYQRFASTLSHVSPVIAQTFGGSCEEVYYGRAGYCILPIANSIDGRLGSFYRLLDKHDLKIACTCDVPQNEDSTVKMALLRRGVAYQSQIEFLEISALLPECAGVGTVLSACEQTGAEIRRADAVPLSYTDEKCSYHILFYFSANSRREQLDALLLFLTAAVPDYTILGLYRHLP